MKKYVQTFIVIVALVILAVLTVWLTPQTASADLFGNNIGPFFDTYSYKAAVIKLTANPFWSKSGRGETTTIAIPLRSLIPTV